MRAGIPQFSASRRIWLISIAALLLFSLLPQTVTAVSPQVNVNPQATGYTTHVVQAGESLSRIAVRYGVSVQALVTANNIANANQIFVGQRLRIPTTGQQPAPSQQTSACARSHTVVAGETLSGIAVNYAVTIQSLAQANGVSVTSYVYIGQSLCIPGSGTSGGDTSSGGSGTGTGTGGFWYEVQLGDTLSRIAFNNGTTVSAVMRANNLADANTLFWGTRIWIPAAGSSAPPAGSGTVTPQPQPQPQPPATGGPYAISQPTHLNVRGGPGTEYPVLSVLTSGTQVKITGLGPREEWLQVEVSGVSEPAWIYRELTEVVGSLDGVKRFTESEIPARPEAAPAPPAAAPAPSAPATRLPGIGFGYGVQAHMIHNGQEGTAMDKTRELGFGWVKQQIEWKVFESNQGQYGFGDIWPLVNAANARGLNLLFSVVNAPNWSREAGYDGTVGGPPADPQTFASFLGRLAGEYCGSSVKALEVWNEQNLHYEWGNRPINPSEYMALLRPSYGAIKAACPSMYVISGALTPAGDNGSLAMDDFRYFEAMLQQGLANYVDGFGAHPSGYNVPPSAVWQSACDAIQQTGNQHFNGACDNPHHSWSFRSTMEGYRNLALRYGAGNIPIWPTEFGWAAGGAFDPRYGYANDNDFDEQARWTVEAFQMMRNWGWAGPAFLWNLNFRVVADGTEKAQWGIVRNDWSPLPVFHALRNMAK